MRPAITRAPGDAENNCPAHLCVSGDPVAFCQGSAISEEHDLCSLEDIRKCYGVPAWASQKILKNLNINPVEDANAQLYDDETIERIFEPLTHFNDVMTDLGVFSRVSWARSNRAEARALMIPCCEIGGIKFYEGTTVETLRAHRAKIMSKRNTLSAEERHARSKMHQAKYRARKRAERKAMPKSAPITVNHDRSAIQTKAYADRLRARRPEGNWATINEAAEKYHANAKTIKRHMINCNAETKRVGQAIFINLDTFFIAGPPRVDGYILVVDALKKYPTKETTLRKWCRLELIPSKIVADRLYVHELALQCRLMGGKHEKK